MNRKFNAKLVRSSTWYNGKWAQHNHNWNQTTTSHQFSYRQYFVALTILMSPYSTCNSTDIYQQDTGQYITKSLLKCFSCIAPTIKNKNLLSRNRSNRNNSSDYRHSTWDNKLVKCDSIDCKSSNHTTYTVNMNDTIYYYFYTDVVSQHCIT